jgi:uncharacterized protein YgbK (DUF1537 family)
MALPLEQPVSMSALLSALPPEWPHDPFPEIQRRVAASNRRVAVLDDDPTGTQTVHDLWVLTRWTPAALHRALSDSGPVFYLLTNSRSLPTADAVALNREVASHLATAAQSLSCDLDVISRSDSTLRGHFPAETEALQSVLQDRTPWRYDGVIICPFFLEGGRLTAHDIHWVAEGETLVPAAQTEYARDATFGYAHSDLRAWIQEKTEGRVLADDVLSISLDRVRTAGPQGVREALQQVTNGRMAVVNAVSYRDLCVFVLGLLQAQDRGQRFLFRTAASFVKVRGGVSSRGLLSAGDVVGAGVGPGLIVVGSYVDKTTRQLRQAMALADLAAVELRVGKVLDRETGASEVERVAHLAAEALADGQDALVYTSRERLTDRGQAGELDIGGQVSRALVRVVRRIAVRPRFVIAKGGITASDVATLALEVQRAWVLGQLLPGVPVWRLGDESTFPGLPYVVFPGNVGTDESLAQAIHILRGRP